MTVEADIRDSDPDDSPPAVDTGPPPRKEIQGVPVDLGPCEYISPVTGTIEGDPTCDQPGTVQFNLDIAVEMALAAAPRPTLRVAPGWAITGKEGYLEILGPSTFTGGGAGFPVTWTCSVTSSQVNWGDGRQQAVARASAGPWPSGKVTHVYTDRGRYQVSLNDTWACTFNAPAGPVALSLTTTSAPYALRVDELQAVGRR